MAKDKLKVNNVQQSIDTEEREILFNQRRAFGNEEAYRRNRAEWQEFPDRRFVSDYPLHVDIELSSICNLRCPMCYTITEDFKSRVNVGFMDYELFKKIVNECVDGNVFSIRLSLRGEALLHKRFIDCIKYAKEKGIKEVSTLTNGKKLLDRDFCKSMITAGLDWITVSIDGVDAVYEGIRKPVTFKGIMRAMNNLMGVRKELNYQKPAIKIQGIWPAVKQNIDAYIDYFTPLSDLIYTNPLVDYLSCDDPEKIEYMSDFVCYQPFQRLVIASDGKVLMCANDQLGEMDIGDANGMTISELWRGKRMEEIREYHTSCNALKKYYTCRTCQIPRVREYEEADVKGRRVLIENYKNRSQIIGE